MSSKSFLKVGDKVRIINELFDTKVSYVPEMQPCCGELATITATAQDRATGMWEGLELFRIDLDGGEWIWVPEWLLPIDDSFEPASEDELLDMLFM